MTTIDVATGLPELPEGYAFRVLKQPVEDRYPLFPYPGRPLTVAIVYRSQFFVEDVYSWTPRSYAFNNPKSVFKAAERAVRKWERQKNKNSRVNNKYGDLVGLYPPKTLNVVGGAE
jgi:hypothetical protein